VNYSQGQIDDGFYKVSVSLHRQIEVPLQCRLQILHWTLDITLQGLQFIVQKANVISTLHLNVTSDMCRLEHNQRVKQLCQTLQHKRLRESFSLGMDLEEGSEISTNSALQTQNLVRLRQQQAAEVDEYLQAPEEPPARPYQGEKEAQTSQSLHKGIEQWAQTSQSVSIVPKQRSLADLLATDFNEEDLLSLQRDDTSCTLQAAVDEPGVFPGWALEYLRFYYKV
jgi:hypothetical protein